VWFGSVCSYSVEFGSVGLVRSVSIRSDLVLPGLVRFGVVQFGLVLFCLVQFGRVGSVWSDTICSGSIRFG